MTSSNNSSSENGFAAFNLPPMLQTALARMNYTTPTPVQMKAIPFAMQGRDVLGSAQTGTGKTGAFCIPMIAKLLEDPTACALVLSPTRELATQIMTVAHDLLHKGAEGKGSPIKTALLLGGESMGKQFDQLRRNPRLIIGTPGRINDHLRRNNRLMENVRIVVLDEADRMLDMGFSGQIDDVLANVPDGRQTLMFSATFPASIIKFSQKYLNKPERIAIDPEQTSAANITHEQVFVNEAGKYDALSAQLDARSGSIIVFVKTKHGADKMVAKLAREEHAVDVLHGGLKQRQRERAIANFRAKKTRIMIATDVAARGLDVPHIESVINYDLPQNPEDYVHRIGRTARAGAEGTAISFISPSDRGKWSAINRLLNPGSVRKGADGFEDSGREYNRSKSSSGKPRRSGYAGGGNASAHSGSRKPWENRDAKPRAEGRYEGRSERPAPRGDAPRAERSYKSDSRYDRPATDRPQQGFKKPYNAEGRADRPQSDRPQSDRPYNDRPRAERPHSDRPQQGFKKPFAGDKENNFRSERPARAERSDYQARPDRSENKDRYLKTEGRAERPQSDRPYNDRPRADRPQPDRTERPFVKKEGGNFRKDEGSFQKKEYKGKSDRFGADSFKPKSEGRPEGQFRKERSFGDRDGARKFDGEARPKKPYSPNGKPSGRTHGDKPAGKSFAGKPFAGKPSGKSHGGKPSGGKSFGGGKPAFAGRPSAGKPKQRAAR